MHRRRISTVSVGLGLLIAGVWGAQAQNFGFEFSANAADHVQADDSDSLDITGKELTMEAWVYPMGDGIIVNKEDSYEYAVVGGALQFAINAGQWAWWGKGVVEQGKWHHTAVTYDGANTRGWIDGKLAHTEKINNQAILKKDGAGSPFNIGWRPCCGNQVFRGVIDEVRVSDVVRYTADFTVPKTEFAPDANTRLLWHLNEGKGGKTADASGNKNDGIVIGNPKWVPGAPVTPVLAVAPSGKLATTWSRLRGAR